MYKISILIPVYNVEKYIKNCLESLLKNSLIHDCEIIICDDCTPDNSMTIVNEFVSENPTLNIKIIKHEVNKKIAITRQDLLQQATGKYIIFVDSDDWVESNYLENLYKCAEASQADIVSCDAIKNYSNTNVIKKTRIKSEQIDNIKDLISTKIPGYLHCKLLRREVIEKNNIEFDNEVNICEDMLFLLKFLFYSSIYVNTNEPLYNYRILNSHSQYSDFKAFNRLLCLKKIEDFLIFTNTYDIYKESLAHRKIFTFLKIFENAPKNEYKKYYEYFSGQYSLIKIKNRKTLLYKVLSFFIDTKQFFFVNSFLFIKKIQNKLKNIKVQKIVD